VVLEAAALAGQLLQRLQQYLELLTLEAVVVVALTQPIRLVQVVLAS
jgi:hypothetical protein